MLSSVLCPQILLCALSTLCGQDSTFSGNHNRDVSGCQAFCTGIGAAQTKTGGTANSQSSQFFATARCAGRGADAVPSTGSGQALSLSKDSILYSVLTYARPRDFIYPFDLRSPILDAFFFTASVGRPSLVAISAVACFGNNLARVLMSAFDHRPFTTFFFAMAQLLNFYRRTRRAGGVYESKFLLGDLGVLCG